MTLICAEVIFASSPLSQSLTHHHWAKELARSYKRRAPHTCTLSQGAGDPASSPIRMGPLFPEAAPRNSVARGCHPLLIFPGAAFSLSQKGITIHFCPSWEWEGHWPRKTLSYRVVGQYCKRILQDSGFSSLDP